jgi:DNA-binding NtrC family response regulator
MGNPLAVEINPAGTVTVLSVSPIRDDHSVLKAIIGFAKWELLKTDKLPNASLILQQHTVSVVLCERDLVPGTWIDMLRQIQSMPNPPSLIVTSRLADERLWAEALNLGAWDVLAKPFDRNEVLRSVKSAWQHWHNMIVLSAKPGNLAMGG